MVGLLSITAFAADESIDDAPAEGTVLRVRGLKKDGTTMVKIDDFDNFVGGWNYAMGLADDEDYMEDNEYDRIVVDLYADWTATGGEFSNSGTGFDYDAIYFQNGVRFTLNMNGHTINRAMTTWEYNGEVMSVDEDADVIINDGTIKGGWSCNGAGGIHIQDDARVELNNVNIVGNTVEDDDGGGIAVYDGATLVMNGGSIDNNEAKSSSVSWLFSAGVYVEDSTASFNNVTFKNNHSAGRYSYKQDQTETYSTYGVALYVKESDITIDSCHFYDNGRKHGNFLDTQSIICVRDVGEMTIRNTDFRGNGDVQYLTNGHYDMYLGTQLFDIGDSDVTIENCSFTGNNTTVIFDIDSKSTLNVSDTDFTDNSSSVYYGAIENSSTSAFTNCTFDRNNPSRKYPYSFEFVNRGNQPTFVDCDLGNSTFNDRGRANIVDTDAQNGTASIFGEGSLAMIVSIVAIIAAGAAILVSVSTKKALAADKTENAEESETEKSAE